MLDAAKSSTDPEARLAGVPPPETDSTPAPEGTMAEEPRYSIRIAKTPGTCAVCRTQDTGIGPVGYSGEEPICDLCLLEDSTDLGMILALIAVVRAFATIGAGTSQAHQDSMEELCAFARIFHQIVSKSWPVRVFRIPGLTRGEL